MIVSATPPFKSIIVEVWRPLLALFLWDCAVTAFYFYQPFTAPSLPLTIFGSALAIFLGLRDNSAYQRWWEGRTLWGGMINASRNVARGVRNLLPPEGTEDLKRTLVLRQVAYVNALRCQLRKQPVDDEVLRFLSKGEASPSLARANVANGIQDGTSRRIAEAQRSGLIDTIQQTHLEGLLVVLLDLQGGMERLKNTPLPNQFRFFPTFFTRLFCLLLPIGLVETLGIATPIGSTVAGLMFLAVLQIGDDLVDPFANTEHGLPLNAMCRTIEIDLLQSIGDPAPKPVEPVDGVLW